MTADENVAVVHRYIEAFLSGDLDTAKALLSDDVTLNVPGRNALSGVHYGQQDTVHFLQQMRQITAGSLNFEITDILANEELVVVLFNPSAIRPGKEWISRAVTVYRLIGGAISEITVYQHDPYAFDAFMA
jgi:ketosteroid isomerase-like protein